MTTKRILSLVAAGLLFATPLSADNYECCDSYCPGQESKCGFLDGLAVGADFLYWSICQPTMDYAIIYNSNPAVLPTTNVTAEVQYLEHYFEPGFRVWASLQDVWCGWGIGGSYTRLRAVDERTIVREATEYAELPYAFPGFFALPLNGINPIYGRSEVGYQTFDATLRYGYDCFGCGHSLILFFGVEGLKLDQRSVAAVGVGDVPNFYEVDWRSEYKGLGLKLGTVYKWECCYGFSWFGEGSFSILGGHSDTLNVQNSFSATPEAARVIDESSCLCVPGIHLAAGLDYSLCLCGWNVGARVGYEFFDWWNVPQQKKYQVPFNFQYSTSGTGNLVLHGLFAGAYVAF